jgi:BMFP domain-containing protein YqiC
MERIALDILAVANELTAKLLDDHGIANRIMAMIHPILQKFKYLVTKEEFEKASQVSYSYLGKLADFANGKIETNVGLRITMRNEGTNIWLDPEYDTFENEIRLTFNTGIPMQLIGQKVWEKYRMQFYRDMDRAIVSIRHEVTHALRNEVTHHMEKKYRKLNEWNKNDRAEYRENEHIVTEYERDATINGIAALKEKIGIERWNDMTLEQLNLLALGTNVTRALSGPKGRDWLRRMIREDLVGDKMWAGIRKIHFV